uniref:ABC-type oligopeptide transport system, ATPase component n=1 Tax=Candidatus Actinomarina minuta TaxID=1389454 RepID=S5DJD6_9ACTN|nr:ABC-type oligopeptide transport system, ATPase component [Candidatus Actinomarina minuta]|tara:strand:+ start:5469 stop:6452 length:984 start_codon:yes stop_codon:yes gene_type:complete
MQSRKNAKMNDNLIEVRNLVKHFEISKSVFSRNKKIVKAVDGISFDIKAGETLGLVGQSGCGKTTTARSLCLLDPKTSGSVNFYNPDTKNMESIDDIDDDGIRVFRRNMQMIFQDPYESLNPRWTIKDIIKEPLDIHNIGSLSEREDAIVEILRTVGLTPPENYLKRYPHEISGGQRQRVSIARTLVMKPKFVICDEPTSMLDVSIRISIMDLMLNLAKELDVSYLYITHDLAVARYMCNRIAVMFNGKIVEIAETEELLQNPIHPYTKRLISSIPIPDPLYKRERYEINFDELDKIISNNPDEKMIDVGNEHLVATHDTKGFFIET